MLKSKTDFDNLFLKKTSYYSSFYIIYFCENSCEHPRFAISISKKIEKKAVNRNKSKRQIKALLTKFTKFGNNIDLLIIVKKNFFYVSYEQKRKELEYLLFKIFK